MNCNENMKCFIAACLVQSEFGDFEAEDCADNYYIQELNLLPNPSPDVLSRIRDLHQQRKGQKPFEADYALLDKIKVSILIQNKLQLKNVSEYRNIRS